VFDQCNHDVGVNVWYWVEFLQDNGVLDTYMSMMDLLDDDLLSVMDLDGQFVDDVFGDLLSLQSLKLYD
jgi:hypothetical protein